MTATICPIWVRSLQDKIDLQNPQAVRSFCLWLRRLGYNAAVFDGVVNGAKELCRLLKKEGVRMILSIDLREAALPAPFDSNYRGKIENALADIPDAILWTSHVELFEKSRSKKRSRFLLRELAQLEVKTLETILGPEKQLFYYLPAADCETAQRQTLWIERFAKELAETTVIVFSATAGALGADHMPPHPFWNHLSGTRARPCGQFMPLVNVGAVGQGEGFWPTIALDMIERYLYRCDGALFKGAISLSANIPAEEAFLSCSLWVSAQVLHHAGSAPLLVEEWLRKHRPEELKHPRWEQILREVREISLLAGPLMRTPQEIPKDEGKAQVDLLLARLKCLESLVHKNAVGVKKYFCFFSRDIRKSLACYLQTHQLPLLCALNEEDLKDSFWSSASGTKVWIHENASCGSDPIMKEIYKEVCGMGGE